MSDQNDNTVYDSGDDAVIEFTLGTHDSAEFEQNQRQVNEYWNNGGERTSGHVNIFTVRIINPKDDMAQCEEFKLVKI